MESYLQWCSEGPSAWNILRKFDYWDRSVVNVHLGQKPAGGQFSILIETHDRGGGVSISDFPSLLGQENLLGQKGPLLGLLSLVCIGFSAWELK